MLFASFCLLIRRNLSNAGIYRLRVQKFAIFLLSPLINFLRHFTQDLIELLNFVKINLYSARLQIYGTRSIKFNYAQISEKYASYVIAFL